MAKHALNSEPGFEIVQNRTGTALLRVYTNNFFVTVPRLPGRDYTAKISGTVAVLVLGALCLHFEIGVPCQKVADTVPKFWGAHFSARVNGASVT